MTSGYQPPQPISPDHDLSAFDCSVDDLNEWLKRRALANDGIGASRTFFAMRDNQVIGYYALTVGSVAHTDAPGNIRRNMPDPIPVALLARLAVDLSARGIGAGSGLLRDAVHRTLIASDSLGIRALLIHALSEDARAFYEHFGFQRSPTDDMTLMASLHTLRKTFGA